MQFPQAHLSNLWICLHEVEKNMTNVLILVGGKNVKSFGIFSFMSHWYLLTLRGDKFLILEKFDCSQEVINSFFILKMFSKKSSMLFCYYKENFFLLSNKSKSLWKFLQKTFALRKRNKARHKKY